MQTSTSPSTSSYASVKDDPCMAHFLSQPPIGHIASYEIYRSTASRDLREWVQRRVAACAAVKEISEEQYVRWAIKEFRTLETAKEAIMPIEFNQTPLNQTPEQCPLIGGKPTSPANAVKYILLSKDKNLGIRVWLDNPADPYGHCCFDFINDKRVEIPKPAGVKVHACDALLGETEIYPLREHIKQSMGIAPGVTDATWSTYLLPRGTTVRFRWNEEPPISDVIVRLPMFLNGEGGRPPPVILS